MSDRLTPEREAEIAARAEAATPGPWEEHAKYGRHFYAYLGGGYLRGVGTLNFGEGDDADADRALTVNAQTDITALLAELAAVRAERDQARAELEKRPNRYRATPAEVDWFLRKILTEETLLNYQRAIGNRAVQEAAEDMRLEADAASSEGIRPDLTKGWLKGADHIDPAKGGGHYPSKLLCARHDGFNPCPGAPRCTPREDEAVAR